MTRPLFPLIAVVAAVLFVVFNTFFIVPQTGSALVVQFGNIEQVINAPSAGTAKPGLYMKAPFIQNVVVFDRRNLRADLEKSTVIAADKEQLVVDAYTRWRIQDPVKFFKTVQDEATADARLRTLMSSSLRRVLGSASLTDIVSGRRAALMQLIRAQMTAEAADWGVEVLDVRIRQADFPDEVAAQVFERMRSERKQAAAKLRAEGDADAQRIRAEADKTVTVTIATAREQSEKTRGDGDAKRAAIFSSAYGRDPEFAAFYRSLQAYEKSMPKGTPMVIPPQSDFFKYFNKSGRQ
jgi:modulator of FtsH protease HflC